MATSIPDRARRPPVYPPRSTPEMVLEALSLAALVVAGVLILTYGSRLQEAVPTHYGADGLPDAWGVRRTIFLLGVLPFVVWALLTFVGRFPHRFNYPWTITPENAERQYLLSRTLLAGVKVWSVALLVHLLWRSLLVAVGESRGLGVAFLPVSLLLLFVILLVYFVQAYRAR